MGSTIRSSNREFSQEMFKKTKTLKEDFNKIS